MSEELKDMKTIYDYIMEYERLAIDVHIYIETTGDFLCESNPQVRQRRNDLLRIIVDKFDNRSIAATIAQKDAEIERLRAMFKKIYNIPYLNLDNASCIAEMHEVAGKALEVNDE